MEHSNYPVDEKSLDRLIKKPRLNETHTSMEPGTSSLKLRFINWPPPIIFTSSKIVAEDGSPLAVELVDAATNTRVTTDSVFIEFVALDADITEESLTTNDFHLYILRSQKGNRPLLVGDLTVKLRDGVGLIGGNAAFTDDSGWTRSGKFRLGARATTKGVMEAITRAFVCKDKRGESYQKHHTLYPDSEILRQARIHTVKEFRGHLVTNPSASHRCLEGKISEKNWKAIVSRSMHCVLSESSEFYLYNSNTYRGVLLLSSAYKVMKVSFDGITALNPTDLTSPQQALLVQLQQEAYQNIDSFIPVKFADVLNFPLRSHGKIIDKGFADTSAFYGPLATGVSSSASTGYDDVAARELCGPKAKTNFPPSLILVPPSTSTTLDLLLKSWQKEISIDKGSKTIDVYEPLDTGVETSVSTDCDVVIRSRRGDIINDVFISHLGAALSRREISVHEDFDEVNEVPECRVLIIFFTSTYAPSNLVNILEHQRKESRLVYPIFYGISPTELISNSKNYERFFLQDEPKRWQTALLKITQMPGYTLTEKSESEVIDEIVRDALKVLSSSDKVDMIGMDMQIKEILSLLCIESPDVRSLGIWGTVGVGKTAIAEEIFRRISVHYETSVFLKDFHEEVEVKGHDAVREDLLSKILEVDSHAIPISNIKTGFLRSRLQRKRVLVILDDVNEFRDVETILGKLNYFGPGSRIIITSRNRRVFVQWKIDHVYEAKPLDTSSSLLLLDRDSFQSVLSPEASKKSSLEVVKFSNGNPQVLQYFSKSDAEWDQLLQQIQETSPIYIPGIFEKSCCGLDDNEMSIFLDIACFFKGMDKEDTAMLLDGCGFSTHVGFRSLVDKSLLTISHNIVDMLSFFQSTGREIVCREAADSPGDRSRLWNSADIRDVFFGNTGTSAIEGIFLDTSKLKVDANPYVFEKMCNLRLLNFYCSEVTENCGVSLPQGLEYLPSKLRLLHWENYPLSSLPKSFDPKNLVELNLPNSSAKNLWKGKKSLENLKKMSLSYSHQLTKIPRLSSAPNLEHIDLEGCNSLVRISQSICYLKKLVFLNLKNCSNLECIPSTVDLESLEVLNLCGCSKLESFPEISPNVKELYLGETMIQEIPSSIKNLVLLEELDLENSRQLKSLPTSICKLKHLETLNLSGCSSLERFPDLSRKMKCLTCLDLSRTAIKELPSSISYLTALEELRFVDCKPQISDGIGAHFAPFPTPALPPSVKLPAQGGSGGVYWDDGVHDTVRKVYVGQGDSGVVFVKFEYNKGSKLLAGDGHGKQSLLGTEEFLVDRDDYITSVEVYYDKIFGSETEVITALRFKTFKGITSQPFGMMSGDLSLLEGGKITGFHGSSSDVLHSLGAHILI